MRLLSILLVDDDPGLLNGLSRTVTDGGYAVINARDGKEAVQRLVSGCPVKPFEPSELLRAIDAMVAEPE